MRIVIIEDEINAFEYLRDLAEEVISEMELIQHLDSVEDAINWFYQNKEKIDLIFLDIQLSDGLSFEIFNHIEIKTPVIFTTAYDDFAIEAFKLNSIDYLLKPISKEDLSKAVKKLQNSPYQMPNLTNIESKIHRENETKRNRFLVKKAIILNS